MNDLHPSIGHGAALFDPYAVFRGMDSVQRLSAALSDAMEWLPPKQAALAKRCRALLIDCYEHRSAYESKQVHSLHDKLSLLMEGDFQLHTDTALARTVLDHIKEYRKSWLSTVTG